LILSFIAIILSIIESQVLLLLLALTLTGKDGLVDRMRSKLVGSTDFLAKPPEAEKVFNMVHKHLTV